MRCFVSLPVPDALLAPLERLQARLPRGRLVPAEDLHLTLAFLGDIDPDAAHAACDALDTLRAAAPDLLLSGPAVFGGRRGQAVGLQVQADPGLVDLHDRALSRLRGAGLAPERRRFRPHVTLARLPGRADASGCIDALAGARAGPAPATELRLVESVLHPDGAVHQPVARWPLG